MLIRTKAQLLSAAITGAIGAAAMFLVLWLPAMYWVWMWGGVAGPISFFEVLTTTADEAGAFILTVSLITGLLAFQANVLGRKPKPIPGLCPRCEYPIERLGYADRCPECGTPVYDPPA